MAIWTAVFAGMLSLRGIGDRCPGLDIPFWDAACKEHPKRGCSKLDENAELACRRDSGWACNYLAILRHGVHSQAEVLRSFARACELGFQPGCENVARVVQGETTKPPPQILREPQQIAGTPGEDRPLNAPPTVADYRILLSVYKSSLRTPLDAMGPTEVYAEACRRGWKVACGR
jgi:hypothetical protein